MAVRSTMAALIQSVRTLINDPAGASQTFDDQTIQDVMDESRVDYKNEVLIPRPTFSGSTLLYLDYWHDLGGWEDGYTLKQYLTVTVTPSVLEPIAGHWQFAATTLPPVYISGSLHDRYAAAADLLERWAAKWTLNYDFTSDGQSFHRSQAVTMFLNLAKQYRMKQRPRVISATRSDFVNAGASQSLSLSPNNLDYYGSGDGR